MNGFQCFSYRALDIHLSFDEDDSIKSTLRASPISTAFRYRQAPTSDKQIIGYHLFDVFSSYRSQTEKRVLTMTFFSHRQCLWPRRSLTRAASRSRNSVSFGRRGMRRISDLRECWRSSLPGQRWSLPILVSSHISFDPRG